MPAQKTQLSIIGIAVDYATPLGKPLIIVKETIMEESPEVYEFGPLWVEVSSRHRFAEYGSTLINEAMAEAPHHWLRGFYERFTRVFQANAPYILGPKGMQDLEDTAEDRRLAEAISQGAEMDLDTGIIYGFDDEETRPTPE